MSPEIAIARRLAATAAVNAIAGTRVYQLKLPQAPTLPAIRVQLVTDVPGHHLRGPDGLLRSRVQVDAYVAESGDAYTTADGLAKAVDGALDGKTFDVSDGSSPEDRVTVAAALRVDRRTLYEAEELRLVRIQQDYVVWTK